MGIVEKDNINILNGMKVNALQKATMNNLVGFMIRHACNLLNYPMIKSDIIEQCENNILFMVEPALFKHYNIHLITLNRATFIGPCL